MKNWERRAIFWLITIMGIAATQWSMGRELNNLKDRITELELNIQQREGGNYGNSVP